MTKVWQLCEKLAVYRNDCAMPVSPSASLPLVAQVMQHALQGTKLSKSYADLCAELRAFLSGFHAQAGHDKGDFFRSASSAGLIACSSALTVSTLIHMPHVWHTC